MTCLCSKPPQSASPRSDYGYIPATVAPDGDPLEVLVCVSEPAFPGCAVLANPIRLFKLTDEQGRMTMSCAFPAKGTTCTT